MRLTLALLPIAVGACAFTNVPLQLPATTGTGLAGGDGRQIVVVRPFHDERRQQRNRCGMQKNGYGMDTASALCSEDPAAWPATLLPTELRGAGFTVVDRATKPSAVRVDGALLKIFVEPVAGFTTVALETGLQVRLTLVSENGLDAQRTFFVKGTASRGRSRRCVRRSAPSDGAYAIST